MVLVARSFVLILCLEPSLSLNAYIFKNVKFPRN